VQIDPPLSLRLIRVFAVHFPEDAEQKHDQMNAKEDEQEGNEEGGEERVAVPHLLRAA